MELSLNRMDYLQVGLTSSRTTRLMPTPGGKSQQKVSRKYITQSTVKSIFGPARLEAKIPSQTYQDEVVIKLKCDRITHFRFLDSSVSISHYTLFMQLETNLGFLPNLRPCSEHSASHASLIVK